MLHIRDKQNFCVHRGIFKVYRCCTVSGRLALATYVSIDTTGKVKIILLAK